MSQIFITQIDYIILTALYPTATTKTEDELYRIIEKGMGNEPNTMDESMYRCS